jgi:hypothetical protein
LVAEAEAEAEATAAALEKERKAEDQTGVHIIQYYSFISNFGLNFDYS